MFSRRNFLKAVAAAVAAPTSVVAGLLKATATKVGEGWTVIHTYKDGLQGAYTGAIMDDVMRGAARQVAEAEVKAFFKPDGCDFAYPWHVWPSVPPGKMYLIDSEKFVKSIDWPPPIPGKEVEMLC